MKQIYHVNKTLQIILIFIPFINLWGYWRVGKLWKGFGINVLTSVLGYFALIPDAIIGEYNQDLGLAFFVISYGLVYIPALYFMNKWTNQRNALYQKQEVQK